MVSKWPPGPPKWPPGTPKWIPKYIKNDPLEIPGAPRTLKILFYFVKSDFGSDFGPQKGSKNRLKIVFFVKTVLPLPFGLGFFQLSSVFHAFWSILALFLEGQNLKNLCFYYGKQRFSRNHCFSKNGPKRTQNCSKISQF